MMFHMILAVVLAVHPVPMLQTAAAQASPTKEATMQHATGTFDVKMGPTGHAPDSTLNSMSLDKIFHGDLEGTGKGEMISAGDPASGNAGYVAIERVTGTLSGHTGSFALMHMASMSSGFAPQMTVMVAPGSGTGELAGIYGTFTITIAAGKHSYGLDYAFAGK